MNSNAIISNCTAFLYANQTMFEDVFVECVGQLCNLMSCPPGFYVAAKHRGPALPVICLPNTIKNGFQLYEKLQDQGSDGSNAWIYVLIGILVMVSLCICGFCFVYRSEKKPKAGSANHKHSRLPTGPIFNASSKDSRQRPKSSVSIASDKLPSLFGAYNMENQPTFDPVPANFNSQILYVAEDDDLEIKCKTPLGKFEYFK